MSYKIFCMISELLLSQNGWGQFAQTDRYCEKNGRNYRKIRNTDPKNALFWNSPAFWQTMSRIFCGKRNSNSFDTYLLIYAVSRQFLSSLACSFWLSYVSRSAFSNDLGMARNFIDGSCGRDCPYFLLPLKRWQTSRQKPTGVSFLGELCLGHPPVR
jgi:hypothetical protein